MAEVRAFMRGLRILFNILDSDGPKALAHIARESGLTKPTALRLLCTLIENCLVSIASTGAYAPGLKDARHLLANFISPRLRERVRAVLIRLWDVTGETVAPHVPLMGSNFTIDTGDFVRIRAIA